MSATIGASLRRTLADAEQARLDQAIEAQNEENLAWAEAMRDRREALVGARVVGIGRAPASIGPSRGDVHLIAFPDVGGHVIRGPHPGVVVQTDRLARSSTVIVVPLTSAAKAAGSRLRSSSGSSGGRRVCRVMDGPSAISR